MHGTLVAVKQIRKTETRPSNEHISEIQVNIIIIIVCIRVTIHLSTGVWTAASYLQRQLHGANN